MHKRVLFRGFRTPVKGDSGKQSKTFRASWYLSYLTSEGKEFNHFLSSYLKDKILGYSSQFERHKNTVVKTILIKRGRRNRVFLHLSTMGVLTAGVLLSPFISQTSFFSGNPQSIYAQGNTQDALSLTPDDVFQTQDSKKPRDKIISYTVQQGDTLSTIAQKFGISEDTIRWANNMTGDSITVGDQLQILPVTGIAYKVEKGDTIYTIAKKFSANPQAIVDFPFNDFANPQTFSLVEGQILFVPDGVMPSSPSYSNTPVYREVPAPAGPATLSGSGFTWPVHGVLTQYFSWYHPALDIAAPIGTPILAGQDGVVKTAIMGGWNTGYGNFVIITGSNGYSTLYAHMEAENVTDGEQVTAGKTIVGWIGVTGRTTGPHVHFEIRTPGDVRINPMSFLP